MEYSTGRMYVEKYFNEKSREAVLKNYLYKTVSNINLTYEGNRND